LSDPNIEGEAWDEEPKPGMPEDDPQPELDLETTEVELTEEELAEEDLSKLYRLNLPDAAPQPGYYEDE
jgi:hypothetical protein